MEEGQTLIESVGKNGGTIFSDGNGFWYHANKKSKTNKWRLTCSNRSCRGSAKISFDNRSLTHLSPHTCVPNPLLAEVIILKRRIMKRCCDDMTPLSRIFFEETTRRNVNREVAAQLSFSKMESGMFKARRRTGFPPLPSSVVGFVNEAQENAEKFLDVYGECFLSGVVGEGKDLSVVFYAKQLREILVCAEEWHMDATFKTVPKQPSFRQLFTIMAIHNNQALPIVFCLMTAKTSSLYEKTFRHLIDNIPNLQQPRNIISDYEAAIKVAVSTAFPMAKQVGCWFHFAQCIYRKVQKLGLSFSYSNCITTKKTVQMMIALALLPHDRIDEGMGCVEQFFESQATDMADRDKAMVAKLFRYFHVYWLEKVGSQSFSVFRQMSRTNNCQESFHARLRKLAGAIAHPNIWTFQCILLNLAREAVTDVLRLESSSSSLRRQRNRKWLLQNEAIREAERKLMADPPVLDTFQFLSILAYKCSTQQPISGSSSDEDEGDDDLVGLGNHLYPVDLENAAPAPVAPAPYFEDPEDQRLTAIAEQKEKLRALEVSSDDVESSSEAMACITCCTMARAYAFEPCGHFSLCGRCCIAHRETTHFENFVTCVVCREHISGYKHIFFN